MLNQASLLLSRLMVAVAFIAIFQNSTFASDLGIDLATCMPKGIYNSSKEKISPKKFWIEQNVALEMGLQRQWEFDDAISICAGISDQVDRVRCMSYTQNLKASMIRCYQTTIRMCRSNGGFC